MLDYQNISMERTMDKLNETHYFASPVYMVRKTEYLDQVRKVSDQYLEQVKCPDKTPVTTMTANYSQEPELADFSQYISQTAWNILAAQGYAMDKLVTYFTEMWTQEHNFMSSMDTHIHGAGAQISAFYFLDVPTDGCKMVIYDPRPTKFIISMPQASDDKITSGSNQIVFTPEAGTLILTNSWLPHSFTRNMSYEPTRFVHMNLSVAIAPEQPQVEVV
jgi:uncharacterized protein (TIGR02466 family)